MSSGSFEINTYSWQTSLPVQSCAGGYSQGTMFAVGDCATLQPYSFAEYQSSVGFPNTIDLSNYFASTIAVSTNVILNSTQSTINSVYNQTKTYVSTIPLTRWISATTVTTYPFTYRSTFTESFSSITQVISYTQTQTFVSTGFFGTFDSNIYTNCSGYSYISTFPVLTSTYTRTLQLTSNNTTEYPIAFGMSSLFAPAYPFDFQSTTELNTTYPIFMRTSNVWLGRDMQQLIDSKQYNVFVEFQYNIYVSTNQDRYTWASTIGMFGSTMVGVNGYKGRTTVTRIPEKQYMEVYTKQMFKPQASGYETQLASANSNFSFAIHLSSSAFITAPGDRIYADIFVPGENNFTFTLVPIANISM
jgi:hypothetical protein